MASTVLKIAQIRERLNQFESDRAGKRVTDRLSRNSRAIEALAELASTESVVDRIIGSLIEADKIGRTFGERLEKEKTIRRSIGKLSQAVAELTKFVRTISAKEIDPLNAFIHVQPEDQRRYRSITCQR